MKRSIIVIIDFVLNFVVTVFGLAGLLEADFPAQVEDGKVIFCFILAFLGIFLMVVDLIYGIGRRKREMGISISGQLVNISLIVKLMMLVLLVIGTVIGIDWSDLAV